MERDGTLEGLRAAQKHGAVRFYRRDGPGHPPAGAAGGDRRMSTTVLCYHDYHPCVQLAAEEVLPAAAQSDMGVVMATVLAGGVYVAGEDQRAAVERRFEGEEERQRAWSTIARLEQEESTLPQSAFRWVLADERVSTVSSGAATVAELEEVAAGWGYGRRWRIRTIRDEGRCFDSAALRSA